MIARYNQPLTAFLGLLVLIGGACFCALPQRALAWSGAAGAESAAKGYTPPLRPLTAVRPVYPPAAKTAVVEGAVTLRVTVEKDGSVSNVQSLIGDPEFARSAMEAVRQWRYAPRKKATTTDVFLGFTLPKGDEAKNFDFPPMGIYVITPAYPKEARVARVQGKVELQVVVTDDGTVSDVKVTKSLDNGLDELAVQTAKTWRFLPAIKDGIPVPAKIPATVSFRLF